MRLWGVALACFGLLAGSEAARAQPFRGLYVGVGAGYDYSQGVDVRPSPGLDTPGLKFPGSNGFAALGSLGYGFGNGLRIELEGDYRRNNPGHLGGTSFPTALSGDIRSTAVMANALFDLDIGYPWVFPYLGAGAGYAWTNLNQITATGTTQPWQVHVDDTEGAFAWQVIAGLSFPMPNVPGLSLTTEYRFLGELGPDAFKATSVQGMPPVAGAGNFDLRSQYNHSVLFGLRYAFNVAPPPAAPAPAPVPAAPAAARSYLVFFDWDRADLTDRARQIVREAADNSTRVQYTRIDVNGYTDTSGSPEYNLRLSQRRAQAVTAELVHDGVPREAITVQGLGETHPLVPTPKGVREPQNRRVEIIIR
jgi:outer membrane protein OmpA-like peptidoglycan-associated protein